MRDQDIGPVCGLISINLVPCLWKSDDKVLIEKISHIYHSVLLKMLLCQSPCDIGNIEDGGICACMLLEHSD